MNPSNSGPQPDYNFIMNPEPPAKKPLLPTNSKMGRLITVLAGGFVLLIVITLVFSLILGGGSGNSEVLATAARQQHELIRITEIGAEKARTPDAKNLAVTTKLALQSQKEDLLAAVRSSGYKGIDKELQTAANADNDTRLEQAEQNNRFDEEFLALLEAALADYQLALQRAYDSTKSEGLRETLSAQYASATTLVGDAE